MNTRDYVNFLVDRACSGGEIEDGEIFLNGGNSFCITKGMYTAIKRSMFSLPPFEYDVMEKIFDALRWDSELKMYTDSATGGVLGSVPIP